MEGGEVFKFAVKSMVSEIRQVLRQAEVSLDEIRWIIPHQANFRIIEQAAKVLGVEQERFFLNLDRYGNTSAGSIGLALDEWSRTGKSENGDKLILAGFG